MAATSLQQPGALELREGEGSEPPGLDFSGYFIFLKFSLESGMLVGFSE